MKSYLLKFWKAISHNIGLKLLALASAFLIWISVVNSQDPVDTVTFYNVPVTILNESALIQKDKIPEVVYGSTVTVTVQARKSICDKLTENEITAIADFEKIYVTDTVPIEVSVMGYSDDDVEIIRGQNQYMKLTLEDYATKEFKVRVETDGTPAKGYVVGTTVASPNVITVRGSKLQISRIQAVVAKVNVDGLSRGAETVVTPVVYDMNDEVINSENLELGATSVSVSTTFYKTKNVALEAYAFGEVAEGYEIKSISFQPSSITVAGTDEDLLKLGNRLRSYVDVTGLSDNVESTIDLHSLIDSKLSSIDIIDDDATLAITAYIDEQKKTEITMAPADVELTNVSPEFLAEALNLSSRRFKVRGPLGEIEGVTLENLKPAADLSAYTEEGIYDVPVNFVLQNGITVLDEVTIRVRISHIQEEKTEN